jgi:hypothetical protein
VAGVYYSNGIDVYDYHDRDIYDIPEMKFYTDMANNIFYKGRKNADISSDAAEVSSI